MMCCQTRKTDFSFKNGTKIRASTRADARRALDDVKLFNGSATIENIDIDMWRVYFGSSIFVDIETAAASQALVAAEWIVYLDKRLCKS